MSIILGLVFLASDMRIFREDCDYIQYRKIRKFLTKEDYLAA